MLESPLTRAEMQRRSRSLPYISHPQQNQMNTYIPSLNRIERVESTTTMVKRKSSGMKGSSTSLKISE